MLHVGLGEIAGLTNLDFSMEQYWVLSKAAILSAVQWESINGLQKTETLHHQLVQLDKGFFLSYHEGRLPDEETVLLLLDNFHDTIKI